MRRLLRAPFVFLIISWRLFRGVAFRLLELSAQILPESPLGCRIRAWIYRPFLKSCGRNFQVGLACKLEHLGNIEVGNDVYLGHGCWVSGFEGGVVLKDEVMFGPYVTMVSGNHQIENGSFRFAAGAPGAIEIGSGTWVAAHATVIAGSQIGSGCLVAAGAVVNQDVPDHTIVAGAPAKPIGRTDRA